MLKIQAGKKYKTKDGRVVEITKEHGSPNNPFFRFLGHHINGPIASGTWMEDGRYSFDASSPNHLVEEVPDTQAPKTQKPLKLEVGKKYKLRCGDIVTITFVNEYRKYGYFGEHDSALRSWREDGVWGFENEPDALDIVEEVTDTQAPTPDPIGSEQLHVFFGDLTDKKTLVLRDANDNKYTYTRVVETEKPKLPIGQWVLTKDLRLCEVRRNGSSNMLLPRGVLIEYLPITGDETPVSTEPVTASHVGLFVYYRSYRYTLQAILKHVGNNGDRMALLHSNEGESYARLNELLFAYTV